MTQDSLDKQRELYGETLVAIAGRITSALGLTQARLADVLGLSAPMLSQLLSGHRVKVGNPLVLARLRALAELAEVAPRLDTEERLARLALIRESTTTLTGSRSHELSAQTGRTVIEEGLRAAAPASELERLAGLTTAPGLAALLRAAARSHG